MKVPCPSCGARITVRGDAPGGRQTCPACMTGFLVEDDKEPPPSLEWEVQGARGEMLGSMDTYAIRQAMYEGTFTGNERIRQSIGDWEQVLDRPEFEEVLLVVGVDVDGLRLASQNIKGWKRDVSAKKKQMIQAGPEPNRPPDKKLKASEAIWEEIPLALVLGIVGALLAILGLVYILLT